MPSQNTLSKSLLAEQNFDALVSDCGEVVYAEVQQKNFAVRSVFALVQRAKPGLVEQALRRLLPEFAVALDPVYADFENSNCTSFEAYVGEHRSDIGNRLLAVTDQRVAGANSKTVRSGYQKLRGRAQQEVESALPRIARVVGKYHPPVPA